MNWRKTLVYSCLAQCCGVLCFVGIRNLGLPFLMKSIGYSDSKAMMLMSLLSLASVFQLLFSILFAGKKIKSLLIGNFVIAHVLLGGFSIGYLFFNFGVIYLLVGIFLYFLFTAFGDSCWWPFIHPQIPKERVSTFFTRLRVTWATFSFVGVIVLKNIVNSLQVTNDFALFIFIIGFIGFSRVIFLSRLKNEADSSRDLKLSFSDLRPLFMKLMKIEKIYFIFFFVLFEPLFLGSVPVLFLNDLGVPKGDNFLVQGVGLLSTVVSLIFVNNQLKKVDEERIISIFKVPFIILILALPLISLIKNIEVVIPIIILVKFFAGIIIAGMHLVYINRLFKYIDKSNRAVSMGIINLAIFGTFFISEFIFSLFLRGVRLYDGGYFHVFSAYCLLSVVIYLLGLNRKNSSAIRA